MDNPLSTDKAMAWNSTNYKGGSGNFVDTYQSTEVGSVVMREESPVLELLSAATRGVVATPDADKWAPRRLVEFVYTLFLPVRDNDIKRSEEHTSELQSLMRISYAVFCLK